MAGYQRFLLLERKAYGEGIGSCGPHAVELSRDPEV